MPMRYAIRGAAAGRLTLLAAAIAIAGQAQAQAQTPAPLSDPAKAMIGAWEISNAARDKRCAVSFKSEAVTGAAATGFKLEFDPPCADFPVLADVGVWAIGPKDAVRLFDSKGAIILDFNEVESGMFEAERKGEGLFFMRSQAAIKAATVSPEQLFGDWTLLQEADKPLCRLTLSNVSGGEDTYRIVVKPGCAAAIAGLGLATWRLEVNDLLLAGPGGTWRFSESDATVWERIPPSTDPMVLIRQ
ncbi:MAG: AprI/Inh family metalloprotease inhibitor [Pseudolabrys sp.]